jgi:hypothetical protein
MMNILKKSVQTRHEYFIVKLMTHDESQQTVLRFDQRDRGTGIDDPSADDPPNSAKYTDVASPAKPTVVSPRDRDVGLCSRRTMIIPPLICSIWYASTRITTSVCGTDAVDRVWSNPKHPAHDIIVRSIRYARTQSPTLLDLVAAFNAVSNQCSKYSLANCRCC